MIENAKLNEVSDTNKIERIAEVGSANGLHMQPSMKLVKCANDFASRITISKERQSVDAKSIMQVTMLGATKGTKLTVSAIGPDAVEAIEAVAALIEASEENI